jgi:hypothetical protein
MPCPPGYYVNGGTGACTIVNSSTHCACVVDSLTNNNTQVNWHMQCGTNSGTTCTLTTCECRLNGY